MRSLLFFALIFVGVPTFAGSMAACLQQYKKMPEACDAKAKEAVAKSNAAAGQVAAKDCPVRPSGEFSFVNCGNKNGQVNEFTKGLLSGAASECDGFKTKCDSACSNLPPTENQAKAESLRKECGNKIAATQKNLTDGANANSGATDGSEKTADNSKGNGSAPAMPALPQQSNNDEEKTDATQPQSTPQQALATPQPQQQEDKKNGSTGFEDDKKAQSADAACSGGKFMCPGCPGFLQKCPNGDANACISKMSSSDQNIMSANCGVSAGNSTAQALTNPTTPQSMSGMSLGGSSGGTSGTVSGGMNTQSMLDDGKKNDAESHGGRKEGGSLGTESAGGGSGSSGSFGSSGSDLFGDTGSAANSLNVNKAVSRSLASAFQASTDSKIVDRYGPNLFSILGETIKGRCDRNLLLHCPNRK
jgi:hypothetical protein